MRTTVTQRETIEFLLTHYTDVINGIYPEPRTHDGPTLMCRAWNHPAYQQLEHLRLELRRQHPKLHWHLAETYIRPIQRRTAYCQRCHQHAPSSHIGHVHTHGRRTTALIPRIQRIISPLVRPVLVAEAIDWIQFRWQGEPQIPDDLRGLAGLEECEPQVA